MPPFGNITTSENAIVQIAQEMAPLIVARVADRGAAECNTVARGLLLCWIFQGHAAPLTPFLEPDVCINRRLMAPSTNLEKQFWRRCWQLRRRGKSLPMSTTGPSSTECPATYSTVSSQSQRIADKNRGASGLCASGGERERYSYRFMGPTRTLRLLTGKSNAKFGHSVPC